MCDVLLVAKFTGIACRVYFKSYMYVKSIKVHKQFIKYLLIVLKFRPRYVHSIQNRDKCENIHSSLLGETYNMLFFGITIRKNQSLNNVR